MLNGLAVPFIVPRTPVTEIGTLMEEGYLPAVARSFEEAFPAELDLYIIDENGVIIRTTFATALGIDPGLKAQVDADLNA